ncbi:2-oxoglutarate decarboxylase/hydro-lyase/magnesium ion-binding protein [Actinidia rufa]|uniref:2-oxoglutarate decarboxylase/hydro-lyase/magnesium ion-binding protein n=1 Tax=Actinidia rufa TaxID=165716 RepID=A0A7J0H5H2_9ERIC|nr:2-oxoglutarate decarboxylase/hydro-lyase/magnesium ion-binding protein [Actinidia rufa]
MKSSSLLNILHPRTTAEVEVSVRYSTVQICALIESNGTPEYVSDIAATLVGEGFSAIKLKLARRPDPIEDATVIQEGRKKVGCQINLRADANRKWTYEAAVHFSSSVMNCDLQYIEEPVQDEDHIIKFCEQTGLPIALDETIGNITENHFKMLAKFTHSGVAAVCMPRGQYIFRKEIQNFHSMPHLEHFCTDCKMGLATWEDECYACRAMNKEPSTSIAHGLGTYRWLKEDTTYEYLNIHRNPESGFMEASVNDAVCLLGKFQINHNVILRNFTEEQVHRYQLTADSDGFSISFNVQEIGASAGNNVLVFLHGFLGTGEDWMPIMKAVSVSARCIAVDLPGHGRSNFQYFGIRDTAREPSLSIEVVADIVMKLIDNITPGKVTLVGYSMGARTALYMAIRCTTKLEGAVVLSGSPGLKDMSARKFCRAKDDSRACCLIAHGLELFLDTCYYMINNVVLFLYLSSLRGHPYFRQIVASRLQHNDLHTLVKVQMGRGSWRPPARPNTARSGTTGGIVCYRCGVEGHMVCNCPLPWADKCYQCGQPVHIEKHCTQGPIAALSVGSAVGGGRGATRSA